jgi:hypothetical protein
VVSGRNQWVHRQDQVCNFLAMHLSVILSVHLSIALSVAFISKHFVPMGKLLAAYREAPVSFISTYPVWIKQMQRNEKSHPEGWLSRRCIYPAFLAMLPPRVNRSQSVTLFKYDCPTFLNGWSHCITNL